MTSISLSVPYSVPFKSAAESCLSMPLEAFCEKFPHPFILIKGHDPEARNIGSKTIDVANTSAIENPFDLGKLPQLWEDVAVLPLCKEPGRHSFNFVTVGRTENNDMILPFQEISKVHLMFSERADSAFTVKDPGSTNGTLINNEKMLPHDDHELKDGDVLILAQSIQLIYFTAAGLHQYVGLQKN